MWQGVLKRNDGKMGQRSVKQFLHRPKLELYDLRSDSNELTNLAGDSRMAKTVADLREQLLGWQKATSDPWLIKEMHE